MAKLPIHHVIQPQVEKGAPKSVLIISIVMLKLMNACAPTVALLLLAAVPENAGCKYLFLTIYCPLDGC